MTAFNQSLPSGSSPRINADEYRWGSNSASSRNYLVANHTPSAFAGAAAPTEGRSYHVVTQTGILDAVAAYSDTSTAATIELEVNGVVQWLADKRRAATCYSSLGIAVTAGDNLLCAQTAGGGTNTVYAYVVGVGRKLGNNLPFAGSKTTSGADRFYYVIGPPTVGIGSVSNRNTRGIVPFAGSLEAISTTRQTLGATQPIEIDLNGVSVEAFTMPNTHKALVALGGTTFNRSDRLEVRVIDAVGVNFGNSTVSLLCAVASGEEPGILIPHGGNAGVSTAYPYSPLNSGASGTNNNNLSDYRNTSTTASLWPFAQARLRAMGWTRANTGSATEIILNGRIQENVAGPLVCSRVLILPAGAAEGLADDIDVPIHPGLTFGCAMVATTPQNPGAANFWLYVTGA